MRRVQSVDSDTPAFQAGERGASPRGRILSYGDKGWVCPRCHRGYEWIHDAFMCYPCRRGSKVEQRFRKPQAGGASPSDGLPRGQGGNAPVRKTGKLGSTPGRGFVNRGDGRIEKLCEHGVGHPVEWVGKGPEPEWAGIHGCCGCCSKEGWPNQVRRTSRKRVLREQDGGSNPSPSVPEYKEGCYMCDLDHANPWPHKHDDGLGAKQQRRVSDTHEIAGAAPVEPIRDYEVDLWEEMRWRAIAVKLTRKEAIEQATVLLKIGDGVRVRRLSLMGERPAEDGKIAGSSPAVGIDGWPLWCSGSTVARGATESGSTPGRGPMEGWPSWLRRGFAKPVLREQSAGSNPAPSVEICGCTGPHHCSISFDDWPVRLISVRVRRATSPYNSGHDEPNREQVGTDSPVEGQPSSGSASC